MKTYDSAALIGMFDRIATDIEAQKDHLCALDGVIGDADHGIAMALGFGAVRAALAELDPAGSSPTTVMNTAAKSFLNAVGASSGPLYGTAFMRGGAAVKGKAGLQADDIVSIFAAMAQGIQDRGKAEVGDKTMIDAWAPASQAITQAHAAGKSLADCLNEAAAAASAGAESTKDMIASKGRAARLGERARGHIDPGAASAVIVIEAMVAGLS